MKSAKGPFRARARTFLTCWLLVALTVDGVTLQDLRSDPDLTPKKLMQAVSRFKYQLRAEVQRPEDFLASETGDCDDFATLASLVLREKGFTPRLIAVRMPGLTHVVCYVAEAGSYLDFNNRIYFRPLVKCKGDVRSIADRVSESFDSSWTTASEFLFTNEVKVLVSTIAKAESFAPKAPVTASVPSGGRTNGPVVRQLDISF